MKKPIVAAIATLCAASIFPQGTIVFQTRVTGTLITHVYARTNANDITSIVGMGANDFPSGTTSWGDRDLIGAAGSPYGASTTFAQLLGAPGFNAPESSLRPALGVTSFRTGPALGNVVPITATFNNIPQDAPAATIEMVAWDNSSGLYPIWTLASVAWLNEIIFAGKSGAWNQNDLGGIVQGAPYMINSTDPSQHVQSFNLHYYVPEPSIAVLAGLSAAALLIFRRHLHGRSTPR